MATFLKRFVLCMAIISCSYSYAQKDSSIEKPRHFVIYCEAYGHNYYGFQNYEETGRFSLNFSFRQQLIKSRCYIMASAGWGTFRERHFSFTQNPNHPINYYNDWINFVPFEGTFQIGKNRHFLEIGYAVTMAFGNHYRYYSGSHGSSQNLLVNHGIQYIPRIGYSYYGNDGFMLRIAFTPHCYPKIYNVYQGYGLDKPIWVPFGLSFGWAF